MMEDTKWMDEGTCVQDPDANRLFMSPYLEPFDEEAFYSDKVGNQKLTKKEEREIKMTLQGEMETARTEHTLGYNMYTSIAKDICGSCMVRNFCDMYAIQQQENGTPIYGVLAGLSQEDRESNLSQEEGESNSLEEVA